MIEKYLQSNLPQYVPKVVAEGQGVSEGLLFDVPIYTLRKAPTAKHKDHPSTQGGMPPLGQ